MWMRLASASLPVSSPAIRSPESPAIAGRTRSVGQSGNFLMPQSHRNWCTVLRPLDRRNSILTDYLI